jgi:sulfatase maturation enzyme AslB (radical SAM superfamily)
MPRGKETVYKKTDEEKEIVRVVRAKRPKCCYCGKLMEPNYIKKTMTVPTRNGGSQVRSVIVGVYGYGWGLTDSLFCSLRCSYKWARERVPKTTRAMRARLVKNIIQQMREV